MSTSVKHLTGRLRVLVTWAAATIAMAGLSCAISPDILTRPAPPLQSAMALIHLNPALLGRIGVALLAVGLVAAASVTGLRGRLRRALHSTHGSRSSCHSEPERPCTVGTGCAGGE